MNRPSYWFRYPSEINQRNSVGVSNYARRVMDAPSEIEETNEDDSYSLQDIVEFHPEIATAILPATGARFDDYDENELILDGSTAFQIEPKPGWSMQFQNSSGDVITVNSGENFTTSSSIRLVALQQIVNSEPVTYTPPFTSPDIRSDPFTYEGDYTYPEAVVVSGTVLIDEANDAEWSIQLLRTEDNIETDENEFGYYVRTTITGDTKYVSPTRSEIVTTQEEGETLYDDTVAGSQATIDYDLQLKQLNEEQEEEQEQENDDAEKSSEVRDLTGFIPVLIFSILAITVTAAVVRGVGGVE